LFLSIHNIFSFNYSFLFIAFIFDLEDSFFVFIIWIDSPNIVKNIDNPCIMPVSAEGTPNLRAITPDPLLSNPKKWLASMTPITDVFPISATPTPSQPYPGEKKSLSRYWTPRISIAPAKPTIPQLMKNADNKIFFVFIPA